MENLNNNPNLKKEVEKLNRKAIESAIVQTILNDENQFKILGANKIPTIRYNEKELREAAHAEIANIGNFSTIVDTHEKPSKKRKVTDPDEKVKESRDRNREHAKNTRLRKKAYIYKLKELSEQLIQQQQADERERVSIGQNLLMNYGILKNNTLLFLTYRATCVKDRTLWENIMEESISVTVPITPFRFFQRNEMQGNNRVINGIDAVIADSYSLFLLLESIGQGSQSWREAILRGECCRMVYHTAKEDTLVSGNIVMCRFVVNIESYQAIVPTSHKDNPNLTAQHSNKHLKTSHPGTTNSTTSANSSSHIPKHTPKILCVQSGMLCCHFHPTTNKISSAEIVFDVMSFMQQLQRHGFLAASGQQGDQAIVPNTLELALQPSQEARVILKGEPPYPVLHVNQAWTKALGYTQSVVENCGLLPMLGLSPPASRNMAELAYGCAILGHAGSTIVRIGESMSPDLPLFDTSLQLSSWYTKLLPLKAGSDRNSHILMIMIFLASGSASSGVSISSSSSSSAVSEGSTRTTASSLPTSTTSNISSNTSSFSSSTSREEVD